MYTILKLSEHRAVIYDLSNWEHYEGTDPTQA